MQGQGCLINSNFFFREKNNFCRHPWIVICVSKLYNDASKGILNKIKYKHSFSLSSFTKVDQIVRSC